MRDVTPLTGITIDSLELREPNDSLFLATGPVRVTYDPRDIMDGVIYLQLKYCDPAILEFPTYRRAFEEADIPVLRLERDHGAGALGQLQTRVQAFVEMLS